mmetsp:Transcript_12116/g.50736  ORF Transcript_12116/g.50736 Transcript_12116/m.50736 type:complete len:236 (-) Transcript_12116:80-787(-)
MARRTRLFSPSLAVSPFVSSLLPGIGRVSSAASVSSPSDSATTKPCSTYASSAPRWNARMGGFEAYVANAAALLANDSRRFAAARARSGEKTPGGTGTPFGSTKMGSNAKMDANVPGERASARSAACAPRLCPTACTSFALFFPGSPWANGMARAAARTSSANLSHRSVSFFFPTRGGVEAPCARMSKVTSRTARPRDAAPARSASTSGSNTRPWNPFACTSSIVTGASASAPSR